MTTPFLKKKSNCVKMTSNKEFTFGKIWKKIERQIYRSLSLSDVTLTIRNQFLICKRSIYVYTRGTFFFYMIRDWLLPNVIAISYWVYQNHILMFRWKIWIHIFSTLRCRLFDAVKVVSSFYRCIIFDFFCLFDMRCLKAACHFLFPNFTFCYQSRKSYVFPTIKF